MIGSETQRTTRRDKASVRARRAAVAGAAAAAMTVGLAVAPAAQAITIERDYTWDPVYSSGLVAGLLDFVSKVMPGVNAQLSDTISLQTGPPPALTLNVVTSQVISGFNANIKVGLTLNLRKIAGDTANLYNTVGGIPQPGCLASGGGLLGGAYSTNCRYAIQLATLGTELNLLNAYRAQVASVQGETQSGLIPFASAPGSTAALPTQTNQALIILQNPLRPNGGLAARFPSISEKLGINPTMPDAGRFASQDGKTVLNTTTLDLTWAYDPIGDFPAISSLPAILNSAAALLPLNIVTGGLNAEPLQGSTLGDIGLNLAAVLQLPLNVPVSLITLQTLPMEAGKAFYSTLVPNELPITAAMGLPGTLANFALNALGSKYLLGNPLGDALAPAMKILVNSAYTDVLAPARLNDCATGCGTAGAQTWAQLGYSAYDRTFGAYSEPGNVRNAATPIAFNSVQPLSTEERAQEKADVKAALLAGFKEQMAKPFWGIIVPNTGSSAASVKPATAVAARTAAPVAAAQAADAVPAADPAPAIEAPAPVAVTSVAAPQPSVTSAAAPVTSGKSAKPARSKSDNNTGGAKAAASTPKVRATR